MDFTAIRAGDEIVIGPLTGVRFWSYDLKANNKISSFQWDHDWSPGQPVVDDPENTKIWGRGLNVYKTIEDAMRGSHDAVYDIVERPTRWLESRCGIVLGEVEFWGVCFEHEFGYAAQIVQPTRFIRAWGAGEDTIVDELNESWFGGERHGRDR